MFSKIKPYNSFYLAVSDLHTLYVEECGNPEGIPILFVHGGPGGGCTESDRCFFDLDYFRIILFDQRGAGRSKPFAELKENNTQNLVSDIEKIRAKLKIEKWHLFGGSWGSTLSLVYAIQNPDRVSSLILRGIFLGTKKEWDFFINQEGTELFFPENFENLKNSFGGKINEALTDEIILSLASEDIDTQKKTAKIWNEYEKTIFTLYPKKQKNKVNLALAKIETHYLVNQSFLENNFILKHVSKIKNISIQIIQGRYDIICPPIFAWKLYKKMLNASIRFTIAGHSPYDSETKKALLEAVENLKNK